jgi:hypothetical protein
VTITTMSDLIFRPAAAALTAATLTLMTGATPASAQAYPGLHVRVIPTSVASAGATTSITYAVENAAESEVSLEMLVLDAPVRPSETALPPVQPDADYLLDYGYGSMNALSLGFLFTLRPGQRRGPFTVRTPGLPAIVPYWVIPDLPVEEIDDETGPVERLPQRDAFTAADRAGLTVGVVPPPDDQSEAALTGRLLGLLDDACALGWIAPRGICNSLEVKIRKGNFEPLLQELEAQRGKHVTETAYFLIRANAEHILARR